MSDVNDIILQELNLEEIKQHLREHGLKYSAAALAAILGGVGASKLHKMYKHHKLKKGAINHLARHREVYAGAATGALASAISSSGKPLPERLKHGAIGAGAGALAGSLLKNARDHSEFHLRKK